MLPPSDVFCPAISAHEIRQMADTPLQLAQIDTSNPVVRDALAIEKVVIVYGTVDPESLHHITLRGKKRMTVE